MVDVSTAAVGVVGVPRSDGVVMLAPVGMVTVPVNVGLAIGAYVDAAVPVVRYPGTVGVPVNVGLASLAYA